MTTRQNRNSHEIEKLRIACGLARERWIAAHADWESGRIGREEVRSATENYEKALAALDGEPWP